VPRGITGVVTRVFRRRKRMFDDRSCIQINGPFGSMKITTESGRRSSRIIGSRPTDVYANSAELSQLSASADTSNVRHDFASAQAGGLIVLPSTLTIT
jgi:hypothetical protein